MAFYTLKCRGYTDNAYHINENASISDAFSLHTERAWMQSGKTEAMFIKYSLKSVCKTLDITNC